MSNRVAVVGPCVGSTYKIVHKYLWVEVERMKIIFSFCCYCSVKYFALISEF